MIASQLLSWFNLLPIWRNRQRVWGSLLEATTFDRYLYLSLHRSGWMGRDDKEFFERIVRPGMHVIDVGANVGLYAALFSRLVGESGRVTAIEPDPLLFKALKTNCSLNGLTNVKLYNVAAGASSGVGTFSQSLVNSGDGRMGQVPAGDLRRSMEVRVAPIDEIAAGEPVDFIKIDVQGWEGEVLKGMHQVLTSNPAVQVCFEYWPSGLRAAGFDPKALLAVVEKYGFQIWPASRTGSEPTTKFSELNGPRGKGYTNVYAVREAVRGNPGCG